MALLILVYPFWAFWAGLLILVPRLAATLPKALRESLCCVLLAPCSETDSDGGESMKQQDLLQPAIFTYKRDRLAYLMQS